MPGHHLRQLTANRMFSREAAYQPSDSVGLFNVLKRRKDDLYIRYLASIIRQLQSRFSNGAIVELL